MRNSFGFRLGWINVIAIYFFLLINAKAGTNYIVSNNSESGPGSLRQAMLDALATNPGATPHKITFIISGGGTQQTITLTGMTGPLPSLYNSNVDGLIIDATTQTAVFPGIILVGPGWGNGFQLDGRNGVEIRGFMIRGFDNGIYINNGAYNNIIGGSIAGQGNCIAGNNAEGVFLDGAGRNNKVLGNIVGLVTAGNSALANNQNGIRVYNSIKTVIGGFLDTERNVVSGNGVQGIIVSSSDSVTVLNNYVGLDINGSNAIMNNSKGILFQNNSRYGTIGSTLTGKGNVVGGHVNGEGILLEYGCDNGKVLGNIVGLDKTATLRRPNKVGINLNQSNYGLIDNNIACSSMQEGGILINNLCVNSVVTNNYVGTNKSLATGLGNTADGIFIQKSATGTLVHNNIVDYNNNDGIHILNSASNSVVKSNTIQYNQVDGVRIDLGANANTIGGLSASDRNIISYNGANGVTVDGSTSLNNSIRKNSIFCNGGRGIVLTNGGNNNYPITISGNSTNTLILGTASPNSRIEIFGTGTLACASTCSPGNNKIQGMNYIATVTADGAGNWSFPFSGSKDTITATASVSDALPNNTSEFAICALCQAPVASIAASGPTSFCQGGSVDLSANITTAGTLPYSYQWYKDGVLINSATSSTYTVSTSGSYSLIIYGGGGSCSTSSGPVTVTVNARPSNPMITGPNTVCAPSTGIDFSTTSVTGATYTWTLPTGATITAGAGTNAIKVDFSSTATDGTIQVSVTSSNGCNDLTDGSSSITINASPSSPVITGPSTICAPSTDVGFSATLINNSTYTWTLPTGATITSGSGTNSIKVDFASGSVDGPIQLSVSSGNGCQDLKAVDLNIKVNPRPQDPTITGPNTICAPSTGVDYNTTFVSGATYSWTLPTGATVSSGGGTNAIKVDFVSGASSGTIKVLLTDGNGCNNVTDGTAAITVNEQPSTPTITGPSAICQNNSNVRFMASPAINGAVYSWTLPAGATSSSDPTKDSIMVDFTSAPGNYTISVYASANGCEDLTPSTFNIQIDQSVVAKAQSDVNNHCGSTIDISADAPAVGTGNWSVIQPTTASIDQPNATNCSVSNLPNGLSVFIWTVSNGACSANDSVYVDKNPDTQTASIITPDTSICRGAIGIQAIAISTPGLSGLWTSSPFGINFTDSTSPVTDASNFKSDTTKLYWTITGACGSSIDSVLVTLSASNFAISASIAQDTLCVGAPTVMEVKINGNANTGYTYIYSSSDNSIQAISANNILHLEPKSKGWIYYFVEVKDNQGCISDHIAQDSVYVLNNQNLTVPNLITPNGDGHNDCVLIKDENGSEVLPGSVFNIYNRWGDPVYRMNNYKNGDFCGSILSDGVYYYHIKTGCGGNEYKGWIQIISNTESK